MRFLDGQGTSYTPDEDKPPRLPPLMSDQARISYNPKSKIKPLVAPAPQSPSPGNLSARDRTSPRYLYVLLHPSVYSSTTNIFCPNPANHLPCTTPKHRLLGHESLRRKIQIESEMPNSKPPQCVSRYYPLKLGASGKTAPAYAPSIRSTSVLMSPPSTVISTKCAIGFPTGNSTGTFPRLVISRVKHPL